MPGAVRSWRPWQVHQPPGKALAAFWKACMTEKLLCGWALSDNCGAASLRWLRSCVCKLHIMGLAPCHLNFPVKRQNGETRSVPLPKSMSSQNSQMSTFGWGNSAARKPAFTNWSLHRVGWRLNLNILICPLDSSSEWFSTYTMLKRLGRMKPGHGFKSKNLKGSGVLPTQDVDYHWFVTNEPAKAFWSFCRMSLIFHVKSNHSLKFLHSIISTLQWKPFSLQTPLNKIWMFLCKPVPPANYHQDSRWMGGD